MKHFAHYIKRTVVNAGTKSGPRDLPYAELQPEDQGFRSPAYHSVPVNSGVASRVTAGDTIWLFSQLSSPWGSLPPSLDGKIRVAEIEKNERHTGRYRFGATSDSKWYSLFSATELVFELKAIDVQGNVRSLLNTPRTAIGQALQFLREIADPSPLMKHAARVEEIAPDFISYRMADGTRTAFKLSKLLLEKKRAVFWDRWSLPRRLAERDEQVGPVALDSHIAATINNSRAVWGVLSELYAVDGSYSKLEKDFATRLGKFRTYPPWNDD
ncbi:hypothetical protein D9M68_594910 [compost metagenome]